MSHDQDPFGFQGKGKEPARSHRNSNGKGKEPVPFDSDSASPSTTPASASMGYMSIGNGPGSEHTARLQQMLEEDSGYGGSIASNDSWDIHNQGTSGGVNSFNSSSNSHGHSQAGAIHQIWYNRHRSALARAINNVVDLLRGLQETNSQWPAYYPLVQGSQEPAPLRRTFTSGASSSPSPLNRLRRSATSTDPHPSRSSPAPEDDPNSSSAESCPRLVSPQIAQEFSVLKLDLKLSGSSSMNQTELVHSLEKTSIASLLDSKISSSIKHLYALRDRIEDTSSKVLITGDLNAGKSTFCNALLRRKILPEDQQPCTSMFCEVLDARENANIEEVHAIHHDTVYNRNDETTYDVYQLSDLEELVVDNTHYLQCKVFVKDVRTIDESLLNNGVVDIALIDAPGLNSDTTKTTAVFARQEEIDVVVFVVSAANHFTMTAQEFITTAAAEKAYMFMVVNGFDVIRDKKRCEQTILKQVNNLSPDTYNESKELVHFVSSNAIPMTPPGGPGGPGGGPGGDGGGDEGPSDPNKNKVADNLRDFQNLEQSLRRFVLEKRAKSKLAPARKYLLNTLNDLSSLANANHEVASAELQRVKKDLLELEPQVEASRRATTEVSDTVDTKIEETCRNVYETTRATLNEAIVSSGETTHGVEYPGIFGVFSFAEELKAAMLEHVSDAVHDCEDYAKQRTVEGVEAIKKLGVEHLGDEYKALNFRPDVMFNRRRDMAARQVDVTTEVWDFIDISTLMQNQEKFAGTGMALTVATAVGSRALGINSWMDSTVTAVRLLGIDNIKKLAVPVAVVAAVGLAAYVFRQIPKSLPRRLADKISTQLASDDYVHGNSMRIGQSVRKVLRFPADNLRVSLEQSAKALGVKRDDTIKTKKENEVASKYFGNLMRATAQTRSLVQGIDLDSPPPGSQVH